MDRHFVELTLYSAYLPRGELDFLRGLLLGEATGFLLESLIFPNTLDNNMIFPSELHVPLFEKKKQTSLL